MPVSQNSVRDHLSCETTFSWQKGRSLKTGFTVYSYKYIILWKNTNIHQQIAAVGQVPKMTFTWPSSAFRGGFGHIISLDGNRSWSLSIILSLVDYVWYVVNSYGWRQCNLANLSGELQSLVYINRSRQPPHCFAKSFMCQNKTEKVLNPGFLAETMG